MQATWRGEGDRWECKKEEDKEQERGRIVGEKGKLTEKRKKAKRWRRIGWRGEKGRRRNGNLVVMYAFEPIEIKFEVGEQILSLS